MVVVPSGVPLPFEVTFDSVSLSVAMKVYDVTGITPVLVDTISMEHLDGGTYHGTFTAEPGKSYVVRKSVYTDGSFSVLEEGYSPGTESFVSFDEDAELTVTPTDVAAIAEAVWELPTASHQPSGSFGELLGLARDAAEAAGGSGGLEIIGEVVGIVLDEGVEVTV